MSDVEHLFMCLLVDGSFSEWMCAHVAHKLGQCTGHTEGLPICACDASDMIQSLGFGIQGPGFGCQLFSCLGTYYLWVSLFSVENQVAQDGAHVTGLFQGTALAVILSSTGAQGLSLLLLLQLGGYSTNTAYEDFY